MMFVILLALLLPSVLFSQICPEPAIADFHKVTLVSGGMDQAVDLGVTPDGRVFIAEMQTGNIRLYQPGIAGIAIVGTIPNIFWVSADDGLIGLELDPGFMQNGWIYVDYCRKAALGSRVFLSRFTFANGKIDMASEKILLSFDRPDPGGHAGGGLAFDAQGNLYLSTGDNTGHAASEGYGALDIRDSIFDDQRSSANTNDLRGKVLRIHPEDNGSYTIPPGNLWEAMLPAPSSAEASKMRKEIYAMGFRNPFRISVGWNGNLYIADVGPDAVSANPVRGPAGFDELDIATRPGFFGYPYCMADNFGYNRLASVANGVPTYGAAYDCSKPIDNNSPFNTGIKSLPAPVPASIWYQGTRQDFPEMGSGPATVMVGPLYQFDARLNSKVKFPPQFHGRLFFSDWSRGTHVTVSFTPQGRVAKLTPFNVAGNLMKRSDVAYQFGPEGALYVVQYPNALYRVEYAGAIDAACYPATTAVKGKSAHGEMGLDLRDGEQWQMPPNIGEADFFDPRGKKIASFRRKPGEMGWIRIPYPSGLAPGLVHVRYF